MTERELIEATAAAQAGPVTLEGLLRDLKELGVEPGAVLLVHSSLSAVGWVSGGAQTVILALEETVRPYGTLVMPTHSSQLSDPSGWKAPPVPESWWEIIRETMPAYDPELTPTRMMGVIPETFRTQADVVRSVHPQDSFAARGEAALTMVSGHGLDFSLGEQSPLARLYDADAMVLLLGVGYEVNTSFHLAEYRAEYPRKRIVESGAPVLSEGHRRWRWFKDVDIDSADFAEIGRVFEKRHRKEIMTGRVGLAEARLFPQRAAVDFAVRWMEQHRR